MAARASVIPKKNQAKPAKIEDQQTDRVRDQIRIRAYEIYLQRGSQPGSDLEDWLQAEAELRREAEMLTPGT